MLQGSLHFGQVTRAPPGPHPLILLAISSADDQFLQGRSRANASSILGFALRTAGAQQSPSWGPALLGVPQASTRIAASAKGPATRLSQRCLGAGPPTRRMVPVGFAAV